jgi:protein TonB
MSRHLERIVFDTLLTSHPLAERRLASGGTLALAVHAAVVALAVWATSSRANPVLRGPRIIELGPYEAPPVVRSGPVVPMLTAPQVDPGQLPQTPILPAISLEASDLFPGSPLSAPAVPARPMGDPFGLAGPFPPEAVDERPEVLAGPPLLYPEPLRQAGIQGRVLVRAVVDTLGRVEPGSAAIVESANPGFDRPALGYVRHAIFRPARVLGRPVRVLVTVPIDFRLVR